MSETRRFVSTTVPVTAGSAYGKVMNFSLDSLVIYLKSQTEGTKINKADLAKMILNVSLKNSRGDNVILINNIPLDIISNFSDYKGGWSVNSVDEVGAMLIDLGNIVLEGNDEVNLTISWSAGLSTAYDLDIFGLDSVIGKEQIVTYDYVIAQATQQYTFNNVMDVYSQIDNPSSGVSIAIDDFYGRNQLTEVQVVSLGACLGRAEDFDNFGVVWHDETGLTQSVGITAGSNAEKFLIRKRFFDKSRIGLGQTSLVKAENLLKNIKETDSVKYACLKNLFG